MYPLSLKDLPTLSNVPWSRIASCFSVSLKAVSCAFLEYALSMFQFRILIILARELREVAPRGSLEDSYSEFTVGWVRVEVEVVGKERYGRSESQSGGSWEEEEEQGIRGRGCVRQ